MKCDPPTLPEENHDDQSHYGTVGIVPRADAGQLRILAQTNRLVKETTAVLEQGTVKQRFIDVGCEASLLSRAAFAEFIAADGARWAKVVREAKIPLED